MTTKVINLDDLDAGPKVTLKIGDKKHEMQQATVQSFIDHVKIIEDLGPSASVAQEVELMVKIITRAFPTLSEEDVRNWPLPYLRQINEIIQDTSGTEATTDEEKAKEAEETGND